MNLKPYLIMVAVIGAMITATAIAQYCSTPTYVSTAEPAKYSVIRTIPAGEIATIGVPDVSGYRPAGLILPEDGTVTIEDITGHQVEIPIQGGLPIRIGWNKLLGTTAPSVTVIFR